VPACAAQVTEREVFHHQPGVVVTDAKVVQAHHRRVVDWLGNLVLLQEAAEHVERLVLLILEVARDLQRTRVPARSLSPDDRSLMGPAASLRMQR